MKLDELAQLPESWLDEQVLGEAREHGWLAHHVRDSRLNAGDAGFPDWVLTRRGRVVIVELKTQRGRLEAAQKEWLGHMGHRPATEVYVWRPSDYDDRIIREVLR